MEKDIRINNSRFAILTAMEVGDDTSDWLLSIHGGETSDAAENEPCNASPRELWIDCDCRKLRTRQDVITAEEEIDHHRERGKETLVHHRRCPALLRMAAQDRRSERAFSMKHLKSPIILIVPQGQAGFDLKGPRKTSIVSIVPNVLHPAEISGHQERRFQPAAEQKRR
jgi:hypothetical protein